MLKLKTKRNHSIRNLLSLQHPLEFSPVRATNDELIQEIEQSYKAADRNWHLEPYPDVGELDTFWSGVQQDLESDPEWSHFGSD